VKIAEMLRADEHLADQVAICDPLRWFIAGLQWDGNKLKASAPLEWFDRAHGSP
jgi:hypothetical protein